MGAIKKLLLHFWATFVTQKLDYFRFEHLVTLRWLVSTFLSLKNGPTPASVSLIFCLFKQTSLQFYNKYTWKISIQYAAPGLEHTTSRTWVVSHNHYQGSHPCEYISYGISVVVSTDCTSFHLKMMFNFQYLFHSQSVFMAAPQIFLSFLLPQPIFS